MKRLSCFLLLFLAISVYAQNPTIRVNKQGYWWVLNGKYTLEELHYNGESLREMNIGRVAPGKELEVIGLDTLLYKVYKVKFRNKEGYIHRNAIVDNSLLNNADPNIRPEFLELVNNRQIAIGMTAHEAECAWGEPQKKNRTITANSESEQWVYSIDRYIYIEDGMVTAMQY